MADDAEGGVYLGAGGVAVGLGGVGLFGGVCRGRKRGWGVGLVRGLERREGKQREVGRMVRDLPEELPSFWGFWSEEDVSCCAPRSASLESTCSSSFGWSALSAMFDYRESGIV